MNTVCMSGDVIRDVTGRSVDSPYSACSFTAQQPLVIPRLFFFVAVYGTF